MTTNSFRVSLIINNLFSHLIASAKYSVMEWFSSIAMISPLIAFIAVTSQVHIQSIATTNTMILSLKGAVIANDSYVDENDIGENDNALHCHTDKLDCCNQLPNRAGEWFFPNGSKVTVKGKANVSSQDYYYRNRGQTVVLLNRVKNPPEKGRFRCEVPNAGEELQITYVNTVCD